MLSINVEDASFCNAGDIYLFPNIRKLGLKLLVLVTGDWKNHPKGILEKVLAEKQLDLSRSLF